MKEDTTGTYPIGAYLLTQNSAKNSRKHFIFMPENPKNFWVGGYAPPQTLYHSNRKWLRHCAEMACKTTLVQLVKGICRVLLRDQL